MTVFGCFGERRKAPDVADALGITLAFYEGTHVRQLSKLPCYGPCYGQCYQERTAEMSNHKNQ